MRLLKLHAGYTVVAALITLATGPAIAQRHTQPRPIVSERTSVLAQPGWQAGSQVSIDPNNDTIRPQLERTSVAPADVSSVTVVNLEAGGQIAELPDSLFTYSVGTIANGKVRVTEVTGQSDAESLLRNGKHAGDFLSHGKGERDVR